MQDDLPQGLVIRVTGSEVWVEVEGEVRPCQLRGRFRRRPGGFSLVAGDRAQVQLPRREGEAATIEGVVDRRSWLSRYSDREGAERPIVANVDTLFVVTSLASPPLRLEFIDRVLVSAERGGVRSQIIVNKLDLAGRDGAAEMGEIEAVYSACGYRILGTSVVTGDGIDDLAAALDAGVYAFVGESGVGKSSLLMRLDPRLDLRVGDIGARSGRGKHTTTFSQLYPFRAGYLADTPGVQTFAFPGTDKHELAGCFPEFAEHQECRFHPCTHSHEPDCGVKEAVEAGHIPASRYTSYLHLLAEVEEREQRKTR